MEPARLAHRSNAPRTNRSGDDAYRAHGVERAALEILAGYVFEGLPARPQVHAITDLRIPRDRSNLRIQEVRHQVRDRVPSDDGVRVNSNKDLLVRQVLQSVVESFRLAGIRLGQDEDPTLRFFLREGPARHFQRTVF